MQLELHPFKFYFFSVVITIAENLSYIKYDTTHQFGVIGAVRNGNMLFLYQYHTYKLIVCKVMCG